MSELRTAHGGVAVEAAAIESGPNQLAAEVFRPRDHGSERPGVLFIHGLESDRSGYRDRATRVVSQLGATCLIFDLSGHGESDGSLSELTLREHLHDVTAAFDGLRGLDGVSQDRIGVCGASYGGYLATLLLAHRSAGALLLRAPALYPDRALGTPGGKGHTSSETPETSTGLRNLASFEGPVTVVESEFDEAIPPEVIQAYLAACPRAERALLRGATHALIEEAWDQAFIALILTWVETTLPAANTPSRSAPGPGARPGFVGGVR